MKLNRVMLTIAPIVVSAGLGLAGATPAFATPPANPSNTACGNATAAAIILDNFTSVETAAHNNAPDGRTSHNDLVAAGEFMNNHPLRVQNAANHIRDTPGLEANIDTAAHGGSPDNNISRNDLRHAVAQEIWGRDDVEGILDEIEGILDENAQEFVQPFCQKGGN